MRDGRLTNVEVFSFTEKYVTDSTYYRGTSNCMIIFQLVLILQKIEMEEKLRIQVINVTRQ